MASVGARLTTVEAIARAGLDIARTLHIKKRTNQARYLGLCFRHLRSQTNLSSRHSERWLQGGLLASTLLFRMVVEIGGTVEIAWSIDGLVALVFLVLVYNFFVDAGAWMHHLLNSGTGGLPTINLVMEGFGRCYSCNCGV